jgi:hypothetical protein
MKKWRLERPTETNTTDNFWAGHRAGEAGFIGKAPKKWGILGYYLAIQAIKDKCDTLDPKELWHTDIRYGAPVPPI